MFQPKTHQFGLTLVYINRTQEEETKQKKTQNYGKCFFHTKFSANERVNAEQVKNNIACNKNNKNERNS